MNIDDPRLTAYALDELDDHERTEFEMSFDDEARREIDSIRRAAGKLSNELEAEPFPRLGPEHITAIYQKLDRKPSFWRILGWSGALGATALFVAALMLPTLKSARETARVAQNRTIVTDTLPADEAEPAAFGFDVDAGGGLGKAVLGYTWSDRLRANPNFNTEAYDHIRDNSFLRVSDNPLSTFSIDVDTASYSNMRRFITEGHLPPKDAVRIEELLNYFSYDYAPPTGNDPFAAHVEIAECPWNPEHRLARIGLKGREVAREKRPPSNLVFLIDVSGSMQPANKLPLVKRTLRMLVEQLNENDRVSIVVYAGNSGLVLPAASGANKAEILAAIDRLEAGGSTNGGDGIELAYRLAVENLIKAGVNRVVLCTDGDFNVGTTNHGDLTRLIEEKAKSGVFLSVLGFGMGNLKDSTMEMLADKGNGNYAYIDTFNEARKVLVEQMSGTLITIAKDVKIQIEFNPAKVSAYRLIGYENRLLRKEDFNDDKKDAGEIGAGHTVTALYEIVPAGKDIDSPVVDPLKYQTEKPATTPSEESFTLKLRYKAPDGDVSKLMSVPVTDHGGAFAQASDDFRFAAAVACFGMTLRDSEYRVGATFDLASELAASARGRDEKGYRTEFIEMVRRARELAGRDP